MKKLISQLLTNTQGRRLRGFTLIELLIVVGILGILVVAVLLTLNPAEAQRKARDTARMKDLTTIQAALDQYINANAPPATAVNVTSAGGSVACGTTGWITLNLCPYIQGLPLDPTNNSNRQVAGATGATACPATTSSQATNYRVNVSTSGEYEINVRQETPRNCANLTDDGGNSNFWVEAGTNTALLVD